MRGYSIDTLVSDYGADREKVVAAFLEAATDDRLAVGFTAKERFVDGKAQYSLKDCDIVILKRVQPTMDISYYTLNDPVEHSDFDFAVRVLNTYKLCYRARECRAALKEAGISYEVKNRQKYLRAEGALEVLR